MNMHGMHGQFTAGKMPHVAPLILPSITEGCTLDESLSALNSRRPLGVPVVESLGPLCSYRCWGAEPDSCFCFFTMILSSRTEVLIKCSVKHHDKSRCSSQWHKGEWANFHFICWLQLSLLHIRHLILSTLQEWAVPFRTDAVVCKTLDITIYLFNMHNKM